MLTLSKYISDNEVPFFNSIDYAPFNDSNFVDMLNEWCKFNHGSLQIRPLIEDELKTDAKNIAPTMSGSLAVMDCIDARNELLRMFYTDIGVRFTKDKKERMIESEVSSDNQMLLFNISDMLHQREKASDEINKLFGLNTSVRLSKEFSLLSAERSEEDANIE